ncbi:MAG TPA: hypothetical protein VJP04_03335 [Terriglobales bacterium]|nr:hypothetical protein [Terriglobales bacterium]
MKTTIKAMIEASIILRGVSVGGGIGFRASGQHLATARVPAARMPHLDAGGKFRESWPETLLIANQAGQ